MSAFGRRIFATLRLVLTLAAGVSAGLATAFLAVGGEPPFGAVHSGAWTAWPTAGTLDADPYARAVAARDGRLPLATGAGLRFLATADSDGQPLVGRCDYTVAGPMPPAQAWTLTLLDRSGLVPVGHTGRAGFTSTELVRAIDGSFAVTVAAQARAGNWLPAEGAGTFTPMVDPHDSPLGTALPMGASPPALPSIVKGRCA